MTNSQDSHYLSLLGLAEKFRTDDPPNIHACVKCLCAVLNLDPPPKVKGRTHLQLSNILLHYTENVELAQKHLEQAWCVCLSIQGFEDVKFEVAIKLAKLYVKNNAAHSAKAILNQAIELSNANVIWHAAILLQNAQLSMKEKDFSSASKYLQTGYEFSHTHGHIYNKLIFNLAKLMISMLDNTPRKDVQALLNLANQSVEQYNGTIYQKEQLKIYYMIMLVCHNLNHGQVKTVKPTLKLLQQSIQNLAEKYPEEARGNNNPELLVFLPCDQLFILVYLVSVVHSVQAGYMEKAHKYIEKALPQIIKLNSNMGDNSFMEAIKIILLEHSATSYLITGSKSNAIKELALLSQCIEQNVIFKQNYGSNIHILLAIYSMSMNNLESAELHFNIALNKTTNQEICIFINLNLAILYLQCRDEKKLSTIIGRISPSSLVSEYHSLRAAGFYVHGLHAFYNGHYDDGKRFLRESLEMANAEDLNRLTSSSLVLLGHIYLALQSHREAFNMVTSAAQLASMIPDLQLQTLASSILEVINRHFGDQTQEQQHKQSILNFTQTLLNEQQMAFQLPEHQLINWVDGPLPSITG